MVGADAAVAAPRRSCESSAPAPDAPSPLTILLKILYWLAVVAISLALLVALVLFFESRDDSTLDEEAAGKPALAGIDAPTV